MSPTVILGIILITLFAVPIFIMRWLVTRAGAAEVSASEAKQLVENGASFIDAREASEFRLGRAAGAKLAPLAQIKMRSGELQHGKPVVVICATGNRSLMAAYQLKQLGFTEAVSVRGGMAGSGLANWHNET